MRRLYSPLAPGLVALLAGCVTPSAPQVPPVVHSDPDPVAVEPVVAKPVVAKPDALPAWTDKSPAKAALVDFVERSIARNSPDYIPTTERIAVFSTDFIRPDAQSLLPAPVSDAADYLAANGYRVRFVTEADPALFRAVARLTGGVAPDEIIGAYPEASYAVRDGQPRIVPGRDRGRSPKPVVIDRHLALRPVIAFGRSPTDFQMLEYTTLANPRPSIAFLVATPPPPGVVPATWTRVDPASDWVPEKIK